MILNGQCTKKSKVEDNAVKCRAVGQQRGKKEIDPWWWGVVGARKKESKGNLKRESCSEVPDF